MATYIGFTTINREKKFTSTDLKLIIRDLTNAFLIRKGEVVGLPDIGTKIWDFIYEPMNDSLTNDLLNEVKRIIADDPRLSVQNAKLTADYNAQIISVETNIIIAPDQSVEKLILAFNLKNSTVNITS